MGGTFTDVIVTTGEGQIWTRKVLSTSPDFERGVLAAVVDLLVESGSTGGAIQAVCHGTTVATNTVLEHRGARTALITTRGFRDVLELRRIRAPQIYDLFFDKPPVLVERYLRYELSERISADGQTILPVCTDELAGLVEQLRDEAVESIAVCLIHSYAHVEHELQVGRFLRDALPGVPVSLSCEVLRQRREYERTATTVVNAYIRPVMSNYLRSLQTGLLEQDVSGPLLIMQSAGGLMTADDAATRPVFALESGPAAGVLAAANLAALTNVTGVISFDMGGTTAKASLIEEGRISYSAEYEVGAAVSAGNRLTGGGGELILAPSIDIAEVGAGGGSIAYLDPAGGLRVGPRSAGAKPGPVCYQIGGTDVTVTDANVALGYIQAGVLGDGSVSISLSAANQAIEQQIAGPLNLSLIEAALGIHAIANARMMRALREVSTQRGRDPRDFSLVAFGGCGPVHAAGLARELGAQQVIVPPMPGLFSAVGLLASGIEYHDIRSCQLAGAAIAVEAIRPLLTEMLAKMSEKLASASQVDKPRFTASLDIRYLGQASQLRVELQSKVLDERVLENARSAFELEHQRLYGHRCESGSPLEVVAVRLVGKISETRHVGCPKPDSASAETRIATFAAPWGSIETPVVSRASLSSPTRGPLLIDEYDATIVIPPDMQAHTDSLGNVVMEWIRTEARSHNEGRI